MDSRSSVSRGGHRTHKVRRGKKHENPHSNDIDNHGKEAQAPFHAAAPDRLNERGHERKHDQRGTSGGHGRKSKSRYQVFFLRIRRPPRSTPFPPRRAPE